MMIKIEISNEHFDYIQSISEEVNEKYFEMGGDNRNGYMNMTTILTDILYRELEDDYIRERYMEDMEGEIEEEREQRYSSKTSSPK